MSSDRVCDECGRWVEHSEMMYHARLQLYAEPSVSGLEEALESGSSGSELEELAERMARMTDEQVRDASDQVHEEVRFRLCADCRKVLHERIARRRYLPEDR